MEEIHNNHNQHIKELTSTFSGQIQQLLLSDTFFVKNIIKEVENQAENFKNILRLAKNLPDRQMTLQIFWITYFEEIRQVVKNIPELIFKAFQSSMLKIEENLASVFEGNKLVSDVFNHLNKSTELVMQTEYEKHKTYQKKFMECVINPEIKYENLKDKSVLMKFVKKYAADIQEIEDTGNHFGHMKKFNREMRREGLKHLQESREVFFEPFDQVLKIREALARSRKEGGLDLKEQVTYGEMEEIEEKAPVEKRETPVEKKEDRNEEKKTLIGNYVEEKNPEKKPTLYESVIIGNAPKQKPEKVNVKKFNAIKTSSFKAYNSQLSDYNPQKQNEEMLKALKKSTRKSQSGIPEIKSILLADDDKKEERSQVSKMIVSALPDVDEILFFTSTFKISKFKKEKNPIMGIFPLDQKSAIVGYWSRGVYKITQTDNSEKPFDSTLLLPHGMTDIVQDAYSRFIFTRPDTYQLLETKDFKTVKKIGRFKNMSDSKAKHLKMSPSREIWALRESNQVVAVYRSNENSVEIVKKIETGPFNGKISDFCFTHNDELLILTPKGVMYFDDLSEKGEDSVKKLDLVDDEEDKMQHYSIDYCYNHKVFFVGKSEYQMFSAQDLNSFLFQINCSLKIGKSTVLMITRYGKPYSIYSLIYENKSLRKYAITQKIHAAFVNKIRIFNGVIWSASTDCTALRMEVKDKFLLQKNDRRVIEVKNLVHEEMEEEQVEDEKEENKLPIRLGTIHERGDVSERESVIADNNDEVEEGKLDDEMEKLGNFSKIESKITVEGGEANKEDKLLEEMLQEEVKENEKEGDEANEEDKLLEEMLQEEVKENEKEGDEANEENKLLEEMLQEEVKEDEKEDDEVLVGEEIERGEEKLEIMENESEEPVEEEDTKNADENEGPVEEEINDAEEKLQDIPIEEVEVVEELKEVEPEAKISENIEIKEEEKNKDIEEVVEEPVPKQKEETVSEPIIEEIQQINDKVQIDEEITEERSKEESNFSNPFFDGFEETQEKSSQNTQQIDNQPGSNLNQSDNIATENVTNEGSGFNPFDFDENEEEEKEEDFFGDSS